MKDLLNNNRLVLHHGADKKIYSITKSDVFRISEIFFQEEFLVVRGSWYNQTVDIYICDNDFSVFGKHDDIDLSDGFYNEKVLEMKDVILNNVSFEKYSKPTPTGLVQMDLAESEVLIKKLNEL